MIPRWGQVIAACLSRFKVLLVEHFVVVAIAFSHEIFPAFFLGVLLLVEHFVVVAIFFSREIFPAFFLGVVPVFGDEIVTLNRLNHVEGAVGVKCHCNSSFAARPGLGNPGTMKWVLFVVCRMRDVYVDSNERKGSCSCNQFHNGSPPLRGRGRGQSWQIYGWHTAMSASSVSFDGNEFSESRGKGQ